jgi:hypothetical protein
LNRVETGRPWGPFGDQRKTAHRGSSLCNPLNEAADFIIERYHARMVNLSSLVEGERNYYIEMGQVKNRDENAKDFSWHAAVD